MDEDGRMCVPQKKSCTLFAGACKLPQPWGTTSEPIAAGASCTGLALLEAKPSVGSCVAHAVDPVSTGNKKITQ